MSVSTLPTLVVTTAYHPFIGGAELAILQVIAHTPHIQYLILTARKSRSLPALEKGSNYTVIRLGIGLGALDKHLFTIHAFLWMLWHRNTFATIWVIMANQAALAAVLYNCITGHPYVLSLQEGDSPEWMRRRAKLLGPLYRAMFTRAAAIQAISHYLQKYGASIAPKVPSFVIPNGIDHTKFFRVAASEKARLRAGFNIMPSTLVFVSASRLVKKNGIDIALELCKVLTEREFEDFIFLVIGDGPEKEYLLNLSKDLGVEKVVRFLGEKPYAEVPAYLQASDVFLRLSRSEGLGSAFLESCACGLPAIATPVGGIPDIVVQGQTGLLITTEDLAAAAEQIENLVKPDAYAKLSYNAEQTALKFNWIDISIQIATLIQTYGSKKL